MTLRAWERELVNGLDEEQLKQRLIAGLDGDRRAYHDALRAISELVYRVVGRQLGRSSLAHEAEDVVQDIVIAIHERRDTYDRTRPLMPWVYAITRYKLLNHLRASRHRRSHVPLEHEAHALIVDVPGEAFAAAGQEVRGLLASLPAGQREALVLTKIQGRSLAEAAERTGITEGAIKVRVHRAMAALRKLAGVK
jgi:RNA polymerase sigma-70 factor (ECF subfamily)